MTDTPRVLATIDDALAQLLHHQGTRVVKASDYRPETVAHQVNRTGLHPIADGRNGRGRHALPWTATHALQDALDGLDCIPTTPRHKDRDVIGGAFGLLLREVHAAEWTVKALTA